MGANAVAILTVILLLAGGAQAGTETVLHSFGGGSDGATPYDTGLLVRDNSGNFYGTTYQGGSCGVGTVFELTSGGTETVLHDFCLGNDGGYPFGGVILDSSGNIYGATEAGGRDNCGTVFELKRNSKGVWSERVLHVFTGFDGKSPFNGLVMDAAGNLYGTASEGGDGAKFGGVAYKISSSGTFRVIYSFCSISGCADGQLPFGALAVDKKGNLYGTTSEGGVSNLGTVFKLTKSGNHWTETVLHNFSGKSNDGAYPTYGALALGARIVDGKKRLVIFGVTTRGGKNNDGTAFELGESASGWMFSVIHSFGAHGSGASPYGTLVILKGELFGTTGFRGGSCCGTVFKLTQQQKAWTETVLYSFAGLGDGGYPYSGVAADPKGDLYGVANTGGSSNGGVLFKVKP